MISQPEFTFAAFQVASINRWHMFFFCFLWKNLQTNVLLLSNTKNVRVVILKILLNNVMSYFLLSNVFFCCCCRLKYGSKTGGASTRRWWKRRKLLVDLTTTAIPDRRIRVSWAVPTFLLLVLDLRDKIWCQVMNYIHTCWLTFVKLTAKKFRFPIIAMLDIAHQELWDRSQRLETCRAAESSPREGKRNGK